MTTPERPDESPVDPIVVPSPAVPSRVTRATWALAIIASLVAGFGSSMATESVFYRYKDAVGGGKSQPTEEDTRKILNSRIDCGAIAFAATGAIFGLALGLAGGLARRSIAGAALAGVAGGVAGLVAEGGAARGIVSLVYTTFDPQSQDLLKPMLAHLGLWCSAGAVSGLAFGLGIGGRGRWWRAMLGGIVGSGLATVAYQLIGALGFPTHATHLPHADSTETRALAQVLIALGAGIGIVMSLRDAKPKVVKA